MIKASNPPRIPCLDDTFCIPIENCPVGATIEVEAFENPDSLIPPVMIEQHTDYVVMRAAQAGTFRLRIKCCPS